MSTPESPDFEFLYARTEPVMETADGLYVETQAYSNLDDETAKERTREALAKA